MSRWRTAQEQAAAVLLRESCHLANFLSFLTFVMKKATYNSSKENSNNRNKTNILATHARPNTMGSRARERTGTHVPYDYLLKGHRPNNANC